MKKIYFVWMLGLSLGGTLFAGYLSFYKLFAKTCAFNESCPSFLGYPACWYGLAMFGVMLLVSIAAALGMLALKATARVLLLVSFLGILFAGSFTWSELSFWLAGNAPRYALGLPTCAYGLIFYLVIFTVSIRHGRDARAKLVPPPTSSR